MIVFLHNGLEAPQPLLSDRTFPCTITALAIIRKENVKLCSIFSCFLFLLTLPAICYS